MRPPRAVAAAWLPVAGLGAALAAAVLFEAQTARATAGAEPGVRVSLSHELGLDEAEWEAYRTRRAEMGVALAALTPFEVLGMYAETPENRRRYAEANARFMLDFHRRATVFEELYRAELARLAEADGVSASPAVRP